jgi:Zn-dependent protease
MDFQRLLISVPGIVLGFTVHEFCHAFAAFKLGDTTAAEDGRLTFNPIRHIDPLGLLFIIIAGFGWAKPVQFNPNMLKKPRRDKAIIAAAGPLSNLLLGLLFIFIIKGIFLLPLSGLRQIDIADFIIQVLFRWAITNLGLFVFNLLPLPPLDGSHIFLSGLNLRAETEIRIMRIGSALLFLLLIVQSRTTLNLLPIGRIVSAIIGWFF